MIWFHKYRYMILWFKYVMKYVKYVMKFVKYMMKCLIYMMKFVIAMSMRELFLISDDTKINGNLNVAILESFVNFYKNHSKIISL